MSVTDQLKKTKTGVRLSVDGSTMFVVATTRLHEVRGQPPARQGSDPYTMISLADGKTILLHIREEEQGSYAWFLFTKSDEPTESLMPVCGKCSKDQENHFDFDFAGMALTARDFGGVNCESMDGDRDKIPFQHGANAMYFIAWKRNKAIFWHRPMKGQGGTEALWVGQKLEDPESAIQILE